MVRGPDNENELQFGVPSPIGTGPKRPERDRTGRSKRKEQNFCRRQPPSRHKEAAAAAQKKTTKKQKTDARASVPRCECPSKDVFSGPEHEGAHRLFPLRHRVLTDCDSTYAKIRVADKVRRQ